MTPVTRRVLDGEGHVASRTVCPPPCSHPGDPLSGIARLTLLAADLLGIPQTKV